MANKILFPEESFQIVGAALEVHRIIGCGFTEPVYQEAFEEELRLRNIPYFREKTYPLTYKGKLLNKSFRPDFLCYDKVIVELKAVDDFIEEHFSQAYNYLKATGLDLCLLINFGKKSLDSKRVLRPAKWD